MLYIVNSLKVSCKKAVLRSSPHLMESPSVSRREDREACTAVGRTDPGAEGGDPPTRAHSHPPIRSY